MASKYQKKKKKKLSSLTLVTSSQVKKKRIMYSKKNYIYWCPDVVECRHYFLHFQKLYAYHYLFLLGIIYITCQLHVLITRKHTLKDMTFIRLNQILLVIGLDVDRDRKRKKKERQYTYTIQKLTEIAKNK